MSNYVKGLVSVVMPTYKRSDMLIRAIDSVFAQSYKNIELILVNDNDPNDFFTAELKKRIKDYREDDRFHFIIQDKHVNGAVARNVGIKKAKGEYIAFLDDDDWWENNKIEEQLNVLKKLDLSWGGVACKFTLFDKDRKIIGRSKKYRDGYIYKDILYLLSDVATGTLLLRREQLDTTRWFDENLLRHQDIQFLVDFTSKYKLKEVDQYLHCVDVSDVQNRPDSKSLLNYKKSFFISINPIMDTLSETEKKCVYAMHKFELGYVNIKNGNYLQGIKYCMAIFSCPKAFCLAMKKIKIKISMINK